MTNFKFKALLFFSLSYWLFSFCLAYGAAAEPILLDTPELVEKLDKHETYLLGTVNNLPLYETTFYGGAPDYIEPIMEPYIDTGTSTIGWLINSALASDDFFPNVDGTVWRFNAGGETWSTIRGSAGTNKDDSTNKLSLYIGSADGVSDNWTNLRRGLFEFDTSIIGAGTISAATFSVYGSAASGAGQVFNQSVGITGTNAGTPASHLVLANSDYNIAGYIDTLLSDTVKTVATWPTSAYQDYPLNATGLAYINKTGYTAIALRLSADYLNTMPTWITDSSDYVEVHMSEWADTTSDPKLTITWTAAASGDIEPVEASSTGGVIFDNFINSFNVPIMWIGGIIMLIGILRALWEMILGLKMRFKKY